MRDPRPQPAHQRLDGAPRGATDRTSLPQRLMLYRRGKRQPCAGKLTGEGYGLAWVQTAHDLRARLGFGLPRVRTRASMQHTSSHGRRIRAARTP